MKKTGSIKLPACSLTSVYQILCAFHYFAPPIFLCRIAVSGRLVIDTLRGLLQRFGTLAGRKPLFCIFQIHDDPGKIPAVIPFHSLTSYHLLSGNSIAG